MRTLCSILQKLLFGKILDKILYGGSAITTGLSDAVTDVPFLDDFDPQERSPMTVLPRGPNNGFLLRPGTFELEALSYCLHAGTYAPGEGAGYLRAPIKGPRSDVICNLLRRSVDHSDIAQKDIQALVWAILARTKIRKMPHRMRRVAARLLTPQEILQINGGAIGLIPESVLRKVLAKLPPIVRQILEAEATLRRTLTRVRTTYQELERIAVLVGDPPPGEGSRQVPRGRWSYHPDGFFVRYFPFGYAQTRIQVHVPQRLEIERDPLGRIVRIADGNGSHIETEYDDSIAAATVPGDPGVRGYAFRLIRFVKRLVIPPEVAVNLEGVWENCGWTLVGTPSGGGRTGSSPDRFADLQARYAWACTHKEQLDRLDQPFDGRGDANDVLDLAHYTIALKEALGNRTKINWAAAQIDLARKAWQYAVCRREGGCDGQNGSVESVDGHDAEGNSHGSPEYDPAGDVATPGNTSRQRLATSARPSKEADPCEPLRKAIEQARAVLEAFENDNLYQKAIGEQWEADKYYEEVKTLAAKSLGMDGQGSSAGDWEAFMEIVCESERIGSWKCEIRENCTLEDYVDMYGKTVGQALYKADRTHEQVHLDSCHKQTPRTYCTSCLQDVKCFREDEIKAYKAGIKEMKRAADELNCDDQGWSREGGISK